MTTKTKPHDAIADAEHAVMVARDVVAGLVERRRAVEQARQAELDRISYLALVGNNKAAQTRLAEIYALAGRHGSELAAIDAATAEAKRGLTRRNGSSSAKSVANKLPTFCSTPRRSRSWAGPSTVSRPRSLRHPPQ
jgi:hypothetical protein